MSAPNGATHALNDLIWGKDCGPIIDTARYYVKVHNVITGACTLTLESTTGEELREIIAWMDRVGSKKVFYYLRK